MDNYVEIAIHLSKNVCVEIHLRFVGYERQERGLRVPLVTRDMRDEFRHCRRTVVILLPQCSL